MVSKKEELLQSFKKAMFEKLSTMIDQDLCLWGSWLGLLLIRLEKRSTEPFLKKLTLLNSNLSKLHTSGEWEPLTVDAEGLKLYIDGYTGININDNLKFTLYEAIIDYYNLPLITNMERGMLNFCTLQSLRYNGLNLLTLIDQIKKIYNVKLSQLIPPLTTSESIISWEVYMDFTSERMSPQNPDLKWMYAREFDPGVFVKMSYNENVLLCKFVAALIDCSKASGTMPTFSKAGDTYLGITNLRSNAKKLDEKGFYIVTRAHHYLRQQFSYKEESDVIADFLKDYVEEKQTEEQKCFNADQLARMGADLN